MVVTSILGSLLAIILCIVVAAEDGAFVVENISRKISLANQHGVETILTFRATRKDSKAGSFFVHLLPESRSGRISRLTCSVNSDVAKDIPIEKSKGLFKLKLPVPDSFSSGTISCQILRVGQNANRPYPAEIFQLEKQRFLFEGATARVLTPYALQGEETTEIIAPRGKIELLEEVNGYAINGNRVTGGPFKKPAIEEETLTAVRVQYDAPFAVPLATYIEREIEVSHWGNVAVEEHYDVKNDGAKLKGEFSRLDHAANHVPHAFQTLQATIPGDAWGVYYRDELGNVTTSNMWKPKGKKVTELTLKLRFPLYGGWHIEWYNGYNVPLTSFVSKVQGTSDRYVIDCELAQPLDLLAEKLVIHLVLPPGAQNVKIESPVKSRIVEEKMFRRYTYLDVPWTARNVLSLELHDVLGEPGSKSGENRLRVYYSYSDWHVVEKPLTISATLFSTLVAFMAWGRISN